MSLTVNNQSFTLNTGAKIPAVGLGTWRATEEGAAYQSVKTALQNGYKHIDAAAIYGNEEEVGRAIKDSGVPREEIFVTTKLWNSKHKDIEAALDTSLKKLGLDYVDLYLIHWPISADPATKGKVYDDWNYVDTYKALEKVYQDTKKIRAIGISNFTIPKIKKILSNKDIKTVPAALQIELHPLLTQPGLLDFIKQHGIIAEAYSPLGSNESPLFKNKVILDLAEKHKVEPAQILISWAVQRGTVVLPKSVTPSRVISNLKTFTLPKDDFETLNNLSKEFGIKRTCNFPGHDVFQDDPDAKI